MNDPGDAGPHPREAGLAGRLRAAPGVAGARWQAYLASRQERRALVQLGESLASARPATADASEHVRAALEGVAGHDAALSRLRAAADASLDEDRADWTETSPWARPLVIGRGLLARGVIRDRRWRTQRSRREACRRLGAAALDVSLALGGAAAAPAEAARAARAEIAAATSRESSLLAPLGGGLLPAPARHVGREAAAFAKVLAREVRGHLLPRVPALAGLVVGWWVTSTFTDSRLSATLHSLGIGSGPRRAVSSETYETLQFWLPILAAAVCSYAGVRIGALVRARYGAVNAELPPAQLTGGAGRASGPDAPSP